MAQNTQSTVLQLTADESGQIHYSSFDLDSIFPQAVKSSESLRNLSDTPQTRKLLDFIQKCIHSGSSLETTIETHIVEISPSHCGKSVLLSLTPLQKQRPSRKGNRPRLSIDTGNIKIKEFISSEFSMPCSPSRAKQQSLNLFRRVSLEMPPEFRSWELDTIGQSSQRMIVWAMEIFKELGVVTALQLDQQKMFRFLQEIAENYHESNPFHNFTHGFTVFQAVFVLIRERISQLALSPLEILGLCIAAICHDVGHRGRTNNFEINLQTDLARLYNDKSVLENHHSALTFQIMQKQENDFLSSLSRSQFRTLRTIIIESILSTDMARHFDKISAFQNRAPNSAPDQVDLELLGFILHCADLSNPLRPLNVSQQWTRLCGREFSEQVTEEKRLGLDVTQHLVADSEQEFAERECKFLRHIVRPLWAELDGVLGLSDEMSRLSVTISYWEQQVSE